MGGTGDMGGMPPMNPQVMQMMQNPAVQHMYVTPAAARCTVSSRVFVLTTGSLRVWQGCTACREPRNGVPAPASHAIREMGSMMTNPAMMEMCVCAGCSVLGAGCVSMTLRAVVADPAWHNGEHCKPRRRFVSSELRSIVSPHLCCLVEGQPVRNSGVGVNTVLPQHLLRNW